MPHFEVETVARRVRETSSLLPGLVTSFSSEGHEYGSEVKVAQLLESPRYGSREHREPITGEARQGDTVARVRSSGATGRLNRRSSATATWT